MKEQVMVLAEADVELLGELRCFPQLVVALQGNRLWLRGIPVGGEDQHLFLRLPATERYLLGVDDLLFLPGSVTPIAYLPSLHWKPIGDFIVPELPVAAYGGSFSETIEAKLVSSSMEQKAIGMFCSLSDLQAWVDAAPEVRIKALKFAAEEDGEVLVMGEPLPTIPGRALWECEGLLLPAGYKLEYAMFARTIRQQLDPEGMDWLVFQADGGWERVPKANLIPATRSGIRQTMMSDG